MVAVTADAVRTRHAGYFYVWMAALFAVVGFGGFAATYWLQLVPATFVGPPLLHLHALLFSSWSLLLLSQTWLAAQGRLEHHRAWGVAGVSLATAMTVIGVATALESMTHGIASGWGDRARPFLIVPLGAIGLFAVFVVAAVANVSRPDWHKRFMLVATAAALQAAVARIPFLINTGGGPGMRPGVVPTVPVTAAVPGAIAVCALLAIGVVYDWRTRGRPHPAYLIGIGAILGFGLLRAPISATPQWLAFAEFMRGFGG